MTRVYAIGASDAFNARMDQTLEEFTAEVKAAMGTNLVALLLGGGYGRGEGGLVRLEGKELPYNDLDFTLIVADKAGVPHGRLGEISKKYHGRIGIHVDFSRPLTLEDVRNWPTWLMWHDLLQGHMVFAGSPSVLADNAPASLREPLPPIEAPRLLLNRGAGVLWSMRLLAGLEGEEDADFIRRNYFKCVLAMGDALLIAHQAYRARYFGRDKLLADLEAANEQVRQLGVGEIYGEALRFKFSPSDVSAASPDRARMDELARLWGRVFLHVEIIRAARPWENLTQYVNDDGCREPELSTPSRWLRNLVHNVRFGVFSVRYPREQLYRQLPVLLGLTDEKTPDWNFHGGVFLKVWKKFN